MASPQVAIPRTTESTPMRVHAWRILVMLAALVVFGIVLVALLVSAA
ncbi:MAG: hypothetical protein QM673_10105 [Gordonia sp. (in: high G+C Gram-positive bacteria)]